MKGNVLTLLTAVFITAMMLVAPLGVMSDSEAITAEEITPASDVSGTYGFYIDERDLESVQDDIIGLMKILDPDVQYPDSVNTSDLKAALQAFFDATDAGVQVNSATMDESVIIGAAIDVKQSAESLVIDVDAVVDLAISGSLSIESVAGEALGDALDLHDSSVEMTAALNAKVVFASDGLYWVLDSIDAEAAVSYGIDIDADLTVGPNHEAQIYLPERVDFTGDAGLFIDIQTVDVGDSKYLSGIVTNNFATFAKDLFASFGITEEIVINDSSDGTGSESSSIYTDSSAVDDFPSYLPISEELIVADYTIPKEYAGLLASLGKLDVADLTELLLASLVMTPSPDDPSGSTGGTSDMPSIDVDALVNGVAGIARDLIGNDGLVASSSEVNDVRRAVQDSMNRSRTVLAAAESDVTFLDQQADGTYREVGTYTVKAGGSVDMSAPVIAALTEPGDNMRFVGWSTVTPTYDSSGAIIDVVETGSFDNVVYGNCYVIPVYAEVVTDLENVQGIQGGKVVLVDVNELTTIPAGITVYVEMTNVGPGADKVVWTATGSIDDTSVNVGAVSEATVAKLAGKDLTNAFEVSFGNPNPGNPDTKITVYVGDRYAPGTTFEVYHVEANKVSLSQNAVTVNSEGAVTFNAPSFSSYVLIEGSIADDVPFDGSGKAPDYVSPNPVSPGDGGNWLLYGGIAIGVIVLLGVVIFLIKRR